jgi:hypothetical protein
MIKGLHTNGIYVQVSIVYIRSLVLEGYMSITEHTGPYLNYSSD